MKFTDWYRSFTAGKTETPIPDREREQEPAIHSRQRFVESGGSGRHWEIGRTYTGRLVTRSRPAEAPGATAAWDDWQTHHDVELD